MPEIPPPTIKTLPCDWFAAPDPTRKTLVVLHGRGDSSQGFHWLPEAFGLRELNYLMVNAPDPFMGGRSWYDLPPDQAAGVVRSRALLDQLFEELISSGHRQQDIALLGFSQGCLMTLEWGMRSALQLAGYVGISGYCLDPHALLAERNMQHTLDRWLITHGRQDEVLPYQHTAEQLQVMAKAGLPLRFESYDKGHTIDPYDELPTLRAFVADRLSLQ